ncbi:hypothetical protein JI435_307880, partial [Parastagonospora nodorum SN15]
TFTPTKRIFCTASTTIMSSTENPTYITTAEHPQSSSPGPIKPTLLAFHGSGSNATVHTVQLARLMRLLRPHFDVESLEAPFASPAGPGVLPFFDGCGPFYRWLPPRRKSPSSPCARSRPPRNSPRSRGADQEHRAAHPRRRRPRRGSHRV